MKDSPIKVKIICYYNLTLSAIFIFGSVVWFIFPKFVSIAVKQETNLGFLLFILLSIFYAFSSYQYLNKKQAGRIYLMISSIIQVILSIKDLTITYIKVGDIPVINILIMAMGLWGIWLLNTEEAKNWIKIG